MESNPDLVFPTELSLRLDLLERLKTKCTELGIAPGRALEQAVSAWLSQVGGRRALARCCAETSD